LEAFTKLPEQFGFLIQWNYLKVLQKNFEKLLPESLEELLTGLKALF
jgi:hypothetical protein